MGVIPALTPATVDTTGTGISVGRTKGLGTHAAGVGHGVDVGPSVGVGHGVGGGIFVGVGVADGGRWGGFTSSDGAAVFVGRREALFLEPWPG